MGDTATKTIKAWHCIGCGRIEKPEPCIGVCEDRVVELVEAGDYASLVADYQAMRGLVLRLARTQPSDGQWEQGYRALQQRALVLLESLARR